MEEEGQSSAPLLEEKQPQTAGCPGCAVDRRKAANPGIPYGILSPWPFFPWVAWVRLPTPGATRPAG